MLNILRSYSFGHLPPQKKNPRPNGRAALDLRDWFSPTSQGPRKRLSLWIVIIKEKLVVNNPLIRPAISLRETWHRGGGPLRFPWYYYGLPRICPEWCLICSCLFLLFVYCLFVMFLFSHRFLSSHCTGTPHRRNRVMKKMTLQTQMAMVAWGESEENTDDPWIFFGSWSCNWRPWKQVM